jgi:hypothetical protein
MNRNQRLVLWVGGILTLLSLAAASYVSAAILAVLSGVAWWKLDTRGKRPENVVIKSVRCGDCGLVGEPHWAKCPKCGASNWKSS